MATWGEVLSCVQLLAYSCVRATAPRYTLYGRRGICLSISAGGAPHSHSVHRPDPHTRDSAHFADRPEAEPRPALSPLRDAETGRVRGHFHFYRVHETKLLTLFLTSGATRGARPVAHIGRGEWPYSLYRLYIRSGNRYYVPHRQRRGLDPLSIGCRVGPW